MDSADDFLFGQMQRGYPEATACAEKVRTFVLLSTMCSCQMRKQPIWRYTLHV